jgi:hypothetical protein
MSCDVNFYITDSGLPEEKFFPTSFSQALDMSDIQKAKNNKSTDIVSLPFQKQAIMGLTAFSG